MSVFDPKKPRSHSQGDKKASTCISNQSEQTKLVSKDVSLLENEKSTKVETTEKTDTVTKK